MLQCRGRIAFHLLVPCFILKWLIAGACTDAILKHAVLVLEHNGELKACLVVSDISLSRPLC